MKVFRNLTLLALSALASAGSLSSCQNDHETDDRTRYQLTETQSQATWKGFLATGYFNAGTLGVRSEQLEVRNGRVHSGTFVMPLASLTNTNLPDDQKELLIHHLQSADFFNMALHPNLKFVITQVTPYQGGDATAIAGANFLITGDLTLLDQTHPISFPAKIDLSSSTIAVQADLKVDRTRWGITYAADATLPDDKHILNDIVLHLDVKGTRQ